MWYCIRYPCVEPYWSPGACSFWIFWLVLQDEARSPVGHCRFPGRIRNPAETRLRGPGAPQRHYLREQFWCGHAQGPPWIARILNLIRMIQPRRLKVLGASNLRPAPPEAARQTRNQKLHNGKTALSRLGSGGLSAAAVAGLQARQPVFLAMSSHCPPLCIAAPRGLSGNCAAWFSGFYVSSVLGYLPRMSKTE